MFFSFFFAVFVILSLSIAKSHLTLVNNYDLRALALTGK